MLVIIITCCSHFGITLADRFIDLPLAGSTATDALALLYTLLP